MMWQRDSCKAADILSASCKGWMIWAPQCNSILLANLIGQYLGEADLWLCLSLLCTWNFIDKGSQGNWPVAMLRNWIKLSCLWCPVEFGVSTSGQRVSTLTCNRMDAIHTGWTKLEGHYKRLESSLLTRHYVTTKHRRQIKETKQINQTWSPIQVNEP